MAEKKINPPDIRRINWTEQQKQAILARGSDVLVTASAGTGKTTVLSGRCVNIVSDKSVCPDVRSTLVLTFTEMAAEQMRSRIAEQLKEAYLESGSHHLRYQLMLLQAADISTIHSFCKRLITEYFYNPNLDLDPTFGVIDADEAALLKTEVLEKTIDWAWQQSNLVQPLQELLSRRDLRTNDGFLAKIIWLNNFLEGVVLRENWCERVVQLAQAADPLTTDLGRKQKQIIAGKLQDILDRLRHTQNLYQNQNPDGDWVRNLEDTHIKPVRRCIELLRTGSWNQFVAAIKDFTKPITRTPRELSEPLAKILHDTAKDAVDAVEALSQLAVLNPEYLDRIGRAVSQQTRVLVELVRKFDQLYSRAKRTLNCLDFADLERYALRLLTVVKMAYAIEGTSEDTLLPSETALVLRQRYKYIFVDEYQDINPVQQAILDALSSAGNVFVVGDVKQSIYAWRGAEPKIFLERLKPASPDPANAPTGLRVDLNANFRSAKGILDFVNKIFSRIMTASFANIDYDQAAHLRPFDATDQTPDTKHTVEFHILDQMGEETDSEYEEETESADEDMGVVTSRQRQAAMIAHRIRQMVGADTGRAEQIYDKEQNHYRDVQYRDIVVLMRSLAKKANDYVEVLRLAGVPVSCQATAGYFQATEISDILSLLKVLDNPQRDIELAAVLRSPIFNVTDTELAKIKLHSRSEKSNFWSYVVQYSRSGPDTKLAGQLKEILARLEEWRTFARRGNLADLIWEVYRRTNLLSFVSALPNGQARRANLLKLHDRAIQFEGFATSAGIPSLTRFVEFLQKLLETGQDWAPAEPETAAGNAVRILSVHKSKGLEFPVVFLAELETGFNKEDIYADCLADSRYTLGLQIIDRDSNSKLRSLAHQVIAEEKLKTALAEEMRILYVATTRAKNRLILTTSQKNSYCRNVITNGFCFRDQPIPDWQLRSCRSPLEWLLLGLSDQKPLHDAFETGLAKDTSGNSLFDFKLYDQKELRHLSKFILGLKAGKSKQVHLPLQGKVAKHSQSKSSRCLTALFLQIKKSLDWQYRFGDAPDLPAKSSVTQLTHRSDEYVQFDYSKALDRRPAALAASSDLTRPVEPRLIGTATHLVISHIDLTGPVTKDSIEKTIEKLLADGAITAAVTERIDAESILAFFNSDLGKIVLDSQNTVLRDWPFTFALPASEFSDMTDEGRGTRDEPRLSAVDLSKAEASPVRRRFIEGGSHQSPITDDEVVIVQGIIDMLIQTPKGLFVIDFKTDDISAGQVPRRAELYRQQLDLYARAASAILKSPLLTKWLHFLTPARAFEIKD